MVAKWVLEYFTAPATWTPLTAKFNQSAEELNGHEEATITLANTSANRALVAANKTVRVSYDTNVIFTGQLAALDYGSTRLKCVLYNECYEAMKRKTITADYSNGEQADIILAAICAAAGVTAGACPSTSVALNFDDAECFAAAVLLAKTLNTDYSASGTTFTIAARGSLKTVTNYQIRNRGVDRAKQRDKVRVRGVDYSGLAIVGEAGTGDNVRVYVEKKVTDGESLNTLAQFYLDELNTESKGAPIVTSIAEGYDFHPGDTLAITNPTYALDGTYPIIRVTKTPTKVTAELERAKKSLEQMVVDIKKYDDFGVYKIEPNQLTPWALNLQGLFGLYHLNEGVGEVAKDSSPTDPANDGVIETGYWVDGVIPGTKVLNFDADGRVDVGDAFDLAGTDTFAVGCWFSPEANYADGNYLVFKEDQVYIQHYGTDNKVRFGVKIGGVWRTATSAAGVVSLYGRHFLMGVYDGVNLTLYLNNVVVATTAQAGNADASANSTFLGHVYHGIIAEVMLWTRTLSAQEVQELYFFPLARIVKKASVPPPDVMLPPSYSGVLGILVTQGVVSPQISEEGHVYNGADATETIGEEGTVSNTPTASEAISEEASLQLDPTVWTLTISKQPGSAGTVDPSGTQTAGTGVSINVTATEAQYWAFKTTAGWLADGAAQNGTFNAARNQNSYTFPAQTLGTSHSLVAIFVSGWQLTVSGSTNDSTDQIPGGEASQTYTKRATVPPETWDGWYLDGAKVSTNTTYAVSAQTAGTSHTLEARFNP
jgi:hypothetical protein